MGWILALVALVVLVALGTWAWRRAQLAAVPGPRRESWQQDGGTAGTRIVLDLEGADPDEPAVQRLVRSAGHQALAADDGLAEVEVVARDGTFLARVTRPAPLPSDVHLPETLHEPHAPTHRGPSPVPRDAPPPLAPLGAAGDLPLEVSGAPLADRLHLTEDIRSRIAHPDRITDIVRAILEAAGRTVAVDGDLVISEDVAIAVVDVRPDADRALTHGFLRIQATDVRRGIVLRTGFVDPTLLRRREAAAPHVRHVGPDALQRMADAVAAGADPIVFAAGPATIR